MGRTMVSGSDVPFNQSIYPSPYGRLPHAHVKDFQKPSLVQIIDLDQVWCWETLPSKDEDLEDSTMCAVENVFFSKFKRGCFVISLRSTDPLNIIELSGLAPFSYTGFRDVIQNRDADRLWICMSSILDQILFYRRFTGLSTLISICPLVHISFNFMIMYIFIRVYIYTYIYYIYYIYYIIYIIIL
jgi:hypothetical protein